MPSGTFLCHPQIYPEQEDPLIVRDLRVIFWTKSNVRAHCKFFLEYQNIGTPDPPKNFGAPRVGASLQYGVLLFSSFYLLKMLFLAIFESFSWSSGRSKFGSAFIQTSVHTYILKLWRFDQKNPSRFLLDPSRTDMFLRWRFSFLCFIQAVFHHQSSLNIM